MVSNAKLDLPDPESPGNTISASRGRSSETSRRLCSRAPRMMSRSFTSAMLGPTSDSPHRQAIRRCSGPPSGARLGAMTQQPTGRTSTAEDPTVTEVRELLAAANRRLLGDTIAVDHADWRAPSGLPGWTRAHVATHLARHADAITRLADWAATG